MTGIRRITAASETEVRRGRFAASLTPEAQLCDALDHSRINAVTDKGTATASEAYSACDSEALFPLLSAHTVDAVTVLGLATDVCLRATALAALAADLRTTVVTEVVRGIDQDAVRTTFSELARAGAEIA